MTETSINISIGNKPPSQYMALVGDQIDSGVLALGEIISLDDLSDNLAANAVPSTLASVTAGSYPDFLVQRRRLMAATIRTYYSSL